VAERDPKSGPDSSFLSKASSLLGRIFVDIVMFVLVAFFGALVAAAFVLRPGLEITKALSRGDLTHRVLLCWGIGMLIAALWYLYVLLSGWETNMEAKLQARRRARFRREDTRP
jgi:hypothetical protein